MSDISVALATPPAIGANLTNTPVTIDVQSSAPVLVDVTGPAMTVSVATPSAIDVTLAGVGQAGPRGTAGATGSGVVGETPTGARNGINTAFTTSQPFAAGSTAVYLNGLREFFYTETGANQITFGSPPSSGDTVRIDYVI